MSLTGFCIGLGNPGPKYEFTRHNLGFMVVDALLRRIPHEKMSAKADIDLYKAFPEPGRAWLAGKPQSFMNRSGGPAGQIARFFKLEPDQLIVVHDELDLPLGRMKLKFGGGLAGHNGLKSMAEHLGTKDFYRLRMGIGRPQQGATADYVLSRFSAQEQPLAEDMTTAGAEALLQCMRQGPTQAQNTVNAHRLPDATEP